MNFKLAIILLIIVSAIISCEDTPPENYIPQTYVEGFLLVDQPIEGIRLFTTQSVSDSFNYSESIIRNAEVRIIDENGNLYDLQFRDSINDYFYPGNETVLPKTKYKLEIDPGDGNLITGETITPQRFEWVESPKDIIHYPKDTLALDEVDSLGISWNNSAGTLWYMIQVKCLDTLDYGIYLNDIDDEELNRRIERPFGQNSRYWTDPSRYVGPLANTELPTVWNTFKWYGKHELKIYAPDFNMLRWFIHMQRASYYEPLLGSIEGAIGVFGSASLISDEFFLIKNQK